MSEEQQYWRGLIADLQGWGVTIEKIAEHLGVSDRQVSNWKAGQRPTGLLALNLHAFHMKHRRILQGSTLPSAATAKSAM